MDIHGSAARFRHRKSSPSSDRFLDAFFSPPLHRDKDSVLSAAAAEDSELNEDDIFSTGDFSSDSARSQHQQRHNHLRSAPPPRHKAFPDSFGILAALPKTALSSPPSTSSTASPLSNSSSSRLIPCIPKPPQDRLPSSSSFSSSFSKHQHPQSAPINVPVLASAMARRRIRDFDEIDELEDEDEGDGGEMLPPHEIVARTQSPILSCPVLEGAGRTLKGRDLRQVRNAIWRQTGFLD
ncbi:unnamed protein product [Linum tenue]|uniref:Senescence regulator n=1 Tax=Linum tenue TaxID=586396 RepID=A0AAV0QFC5_9ROSI|nr:unnamed protein product [Linum tenue]